MTALLEQPLGKLASSIPGATRLFRKYQLDFCCAGHQSLGDAANQLGIDPAALVSELEQVSSVPSEATDWRTQTADALIDHILARFHEKHRQQLPELIHLAQKVERVHGQNENCPHGLAQFLATMQQELESHMMKEEQILFPMLKHGRREMATGPISVMQVEHVQHGEALEKLRQLTGNITPPEGACNSWRALYAGISELHDDLMEHIHLENNILFSGQCQPPKPLAHAGCTCQG